MDQSELVEYWHDRGQEDYPDNWNPPDKAMIFEMIEGNDENEILASQAYRAGWRHAKSQA